jgi:hypothetical protein
MGKHICEIGYAKPELDYLFGAFASVIRLLINVFGLNLMV